MSYSSDETNTLSFDKYLRNSVVLFNTISGTQCHNDSLSLPFALDIIFFEYTISLTALKAVIMTRCACP